MWLCIRGRISLSLASLGVGMWLARPKKIKREMLSRGAIPGVQPDTLLKTCLTGRRSFSDVMNHVGRLCESRNLVRRFKLIPIAGIEKKLDVAKHQTTQWTIKLYTNIQRIFMRFLPAVCHSPKSVQNDTKK